MKIEVTTDRPLSLRDRMLAAGSVAELEALRKEGSKYNNARPTTRSKWKRAFASRSKELEAQMTEEEHAAYLRAKEERRAKGKEQQT